VTLKGFLIAFVILLLVASGGIALWFKAVGLSARTLPSSLETSVARRIRHFAVPVAARDQANPLRNSPDTLTDARRHFADHCASCHANDGSGSTTIGQNLSPKSPDMRLPATQTLSDGELYYIIHNGIRFTGMPAWGANGPDEDSWKLVLFIRHLPQLSGEDLRDMEKSNPKSEAERAEEQDEEDFLSGKTIAPNSMHH
jgi:mono/diheme cytochrome c family protein